MSQAQVEHQDPRELLDELAAIEAEIMEEIEALRAALAERAHDAAVPHRAARRGLRHQPGPAEDRTACRKTAKSASSRWPR